MKADDQIDAEILNGQIQAELLDLETLRTWRKNPMNYVGLPGSAIDETVNGAARQSDIVHRIFPPGPQGFQIEQFGLDLTIEDFGIDLVISFHLNIAKTSEPALKFLDR